MKDHVWLAICLALAALSPILFVVGLYVGSGGCPEPTKTYEDGLREGSKQTRAFDALMLWGNPTPEQIDSASMAMYELFKASPND